MGSIVKFSFAKDFTTSFQPKMLDHLVTTDFSFRLPSISFPVTIALAKPT